MTRIGIAAEIPAALSDADEALMRYGRWAKDRFKPQRCASAEGAYRSPANDDDRQPREIVMSAPEAMAVHRALLRVPDRERIVLQVLYVPQRLPPEAQLRILRIPPRLSQQRHIEGLRMFANLWRIATLAAT